MAVEDSQPQAALQPSIEPPAAPVEDTPAEVTPGLMHEPQEAVTPGLRHEPQEEITPGLLYEPQEESPETEAPETKASAPETKAPETKVPETEASETEARPTLDSEKLRELLSPEFDSDFALEPAAPTDMNPEQNKKGDQQPKEPAAACPSPSASNDSSSLDGKIKPIEIEDSPSWKPCNGMSHTII